MICFVNYHAVMRPVARPATRVNVQPALPQFPPAPRYFNYTGAPARTPSGRHWVVPPPPMPQPRSIRVNPPQAPVYWGPYDQGHAWHDGRTRDDD
jgi:hypothetical protein